MKNTILKIRREGRSYKKLIVKNGDEFL